MRLNPNRDYRGPADPNAYWRRPFIVLLGALTVLAGFAWLFTGNGAAPSAARSAAAKTVQFRLGVPQALTIRWNRQAAGPSGCAGSLAAGASGTFDAVAVAAGQSSQVRAFRLLP
jgi:hypothetical protein